MKKNLNFLKTEARKDKNQILGPFTINEDSCGWYEILNRNGEVVGFGPGGIESGIPALNQMEKYWKGKSI